MSLSPTSTPVVCTCSHPFDCDHACHMRACDPTETTCDLDFLPDEGGLTPWGCVDCTPGQGAPHLAACAVPPPRAQRVTGPGVQPAP